MRAEHVHTPEYTYTVLFEPQPEGGYTVTVPALPGLVTEGDTFEQARSMAKDAIIGYLEVLKKQGRQIPLDVELGERTRKEKVTVAVTNA